MSRNLTTAALLAILALPVAARADQAPLPLDKLTGENWYGAYLNGVKIGHARIRTGPRRVKGAKVFELAFMMDTSLTLEGKVRRHRMYIRERFSLLPPHRFLGSHNSSNYDGKKTGVTEQVIGERMKVTFTTATGTRRQERARPRVTLGEAMKTNIACLDELKVGARYESVGWSALRQRETRRRHQVLRIEPRMVDGLNTRLAHVREASDGRAPTVNIYELGTGRELQFSLYRGMVLRLESREVATDKALVKDYLLTSDIALDRPLGFDDPAGVQRCVLLLPGLRASDIRQRPGVQVREASGGVQVTLSRAPAPRPITLPLPIPLPREARDALKEAPFIQSRNKEMVAQARAIVDNKDTPRQKAEKIVRWVYRSMKKERAFDSDALQILRKMSGDCSEHARLTVALARAAGVPAEEVGGFTYTGDHSGTFGAHGWVRFFISGAWLEMDPALGQVEVDVTHLPLASSGGLHLHGKTIKVLEVDDGPAVPASEAEDRLLRRVESSLADGDPEVMDHAIHHGLMARRALDRMEGKPELKRHFTTGLLTAREKTIKKGTSWGRMLVRMISRGETFRLLRKVRRGAEVRGLFRLVNRDRALNYFELVLRRLPAGPVKIVDIYNYSAGELVTDQIKRFYTLTLGDQKRGFFSRLFSSRPSAISQLKMLSKLADQVRGEKFAEALVTYSRLPKELKREKLSLILRLTAAEKVGDKEYQVALADLRRFHPKDPSGDLHGIDYFYLKKQYGKARRLLRRLDRQVGGDPYLKVIQGGSFLDENQPRRALRLMDQALKEAPELIEAWDGKLSVLLVLARWKAVLTLLQELEKQHGVAITDFTEVEFKRFIKTPQYRQWVEAHPAPPAKDL